LVSTSRCPDPRRFAFLPPKWARTIECSQGRRTVAQALALARRGGWGEAEGKRSWGFSLNCKGLVGLGQTTCIWGQERVLYCRPWIGLFPLPPIRLCLAKAAYESVVCPDFPSNGPFADAVASIPMEAIHSAPRQNDRKQLAAFVERGAVSF